VKSYGSAAAKLLKKTFSVAASYPSKPKLKQATLVFKKEL
jgi:hypothetical protein